jgi:hypothetical protein
MSATAVQAQPDANMNGLYQRIDAPAPMPAPASTPTPAAHAPPPSGGPTPHAYAVPPWLDALRQNHVCTATRTPLSGEIRVMNKRVALLVRPSLFSTQEGQP